MNNTIANGNLLAHSNFLARAILNESNILQYCMWYQLHSPHPKVTGASLHHDLKVISLMSAGMH